MALPPAVKPRRGLSLPFRRAAAAARELLVTLACKRWQVERNTVQVENGVITHAATKRTLSYADLGGTGDIGAAFAQTIPADIALTPVRQWKVMGTSLRRPNARDLVMGTHRYASDVIRPGMLYGKVLRAQASAPRSRKSIWPPPRRWTE